MFSSPPSSEIDPRCPMSHAPHSILPSHLVGVAVTPLVTLGLFGGPHDGNAERGSR